MKNKVPVIFNGMKLVKEYPSFALYKRKYTDVWGREYTLRECFNYWDLGVNTKQGVASRGIHISNHV